MAISSFYRDPQALEYSNASANIEPDEEAYHVEDMPDGSSVYQFGELAEIEEEPISDFYANLCEKLNSGELNRIAGELLDGIKEDKESRQGWEHGLNEGLKLLGWKVEDSKDVPFMRACSAFDTTLAQALLRTWSTARAELFPSQGPANFQVLGQPSEELEDKGERVKDWINFYLTEIDKDYYPDSEQMLLYLIMAGGIIRKIQQDPIKKQPIGRFILPQDFIVNNNCTSLLSSSRLTQAMYLTKRDIYLHKQSGYFIDIKMPEIDDNQEDESSISKTVRRMTGISKESGENKSIFMFYEVHADLELDSLEDAEEGLPLPYVVTICASNQKIVSVRRNWKEGDEQFRRRECFVQWNYLPGFGLYGTGLAHLLGSNAKVLTSLMRMLVDAGILKNFPGGLKKRGLKIENNDKAIGPSEFWDVETDGLPINQAIMLMPYNEPSQVLNELRQELIQQVQGLASINDEKIAENKADAPVGTTLALLEVSHQIKSSIIRSMHRALNNELSIFKDLFGEYLPDTPYPFAMPGRQGQIMKADFSGDVNIVPVADPNLATSTQRIIRAEALLRLAQSAPQIHDMREAYKRMYKAMNVDDIDKLLPDEEEALPLDPITENMNLMRGKPLVAALWQDHQSHAAVHAQFAQESPEMMAHIKEHQAMQYFIDMQAKMGFEMPPDAMMENPQVQNAIAVQAAQIAQEEMAQQQQQMQSQQPPDPNTVMMADIEARREMAQMKREETEKRTETEAFKATLNAETELKKMEVQKELARDKHDADIELAELKHESSIELEEIKQTGYKES